MPDNEDSSEEMRLPIHATTTEAHVAFFNMRFQYDVLSALRHLEVLFCDDVSDNTSLPINDRCHLSATGS